MSRTPARSPDVTHSFSPFLVLAVLAAAPAIPAHAEDPGGGESRRIVGRLELHPDGRVVRLPQARAAVLCSPIRPRCRRSRSGLPRTPTSRRSAWPHPALSRDRP